MFSESQAAVIVAGKINSKSINIRGRVEVLTVGEYKNDKLEMVDHIRLSSSS